MKRLLFLFSAVIIFSPSLSQKIYFSEFFNVHIGNFMAPVSKDSANYYTIIDPDTVGYGQVNYFYLSGKIYMKEVIENGIVVSRRKYYSNGKKNLVENNNFENNSNKLQTQKNGQYYLTTHHSYITLKNMWNSNGIQIVKNGFGTYYEYYPNGTLKVKGEIKEGERFGIWKWYYDNGTVMLEGTYLNYSHRFKIFNAYYKTGDSQLCNGNGDFILHFPNSPIIAMSANYLNGQLEGETRYYWPNGTLMKLCNYNIGSLNGKFESYYSNGKINSSGKYFEGRPYGIWKKYDKDGRLYFDQLIK